MDKNIGKEIAASGLGWGKLSAICMGCQKKIPIDEAILDDKQWWHKECLRKIINKNKKR